MNHSCCNKLNQKLIASFLTHNAPVIVFDSIDSTNNEAKRMCQKIQDARKLNGTVIIAESQTQGRGRMGRNFCSPLGAGLYLSIIFSPMRSPSSNVHKKVKTPAIYTSLASVAVTRALQSVYNVDAKIKWVNDVFVRQKKVCGILVEGTTNFQTGLIENIIVGIGVNILPYNFPSELNHAGSVLEDISAPSKRNELASAVVNNVLDLYDQDDYTDAILEYKKKSFLIEKKVSVHSIVGDESFFAKVLDISNDAKLIVQLKDGSIKELESAEVHLGSENF